MLFFLDITLGSYRCNSTITSGGDHLTQELLTHVTGRKYAGHRGFLLIVNDDVTALAQLDGISQEIGRRDCADKHEHTVAVVFSDITGFEVLDANTIDQLVTANFLDTRVPDKGDLVVSIGLFLSSTIGV